MRLPAIFRGKPKEPEERYFGDAAYKNDPFYWQKGVDVIAPNYGDISTNTAVYSCVNILAQEVASLYVDHWRVDETTGARERVARSNAVRVLNTPNPYQTSSDFWLYMMRCLLLKGQAFAAVTRNGRQEIDSMHPLPAGACSAMVSEVNGDVFYSVGGFDEHLFRFNADKIVPANRIFHPRINCNRHPLIGETPISAFVYAGATGSFIQRASSKFFSNAARPSGVLSTPKPLTAKQLDELRERWAAVTKGDSIGGTPVLHSDLKWQQVTMSASDAEVIATYNLSVSDISMAYRLPLFMLGDVSKAPFKYVETLMRVFYTGCLRFYLEHLEKSLNRLFGFDIEREYLEFDIESGLLRGDLEQRVMAYTKGIQGALFSPNEARRRMELPPATGGDDLFLQRQMVPISAIAQLLEAEAAKAATQPPAAPPQKSGPDDNDEDSPEDGDPDATEELTALLRRHMRE